MAKILVVEDDASLASCIKDWLTFESHNADVVTTGEAALSLLASGYYDVIMLDWELPGVSGLEVCTQYRARGGGTPILFLTVRGMIVDKLAGLESGADDYIPKPFRAKELMARIRALLRRNAAQSEPSLRAGGLELDPSTHRVTRDGELLSLAPVEFAVLEHFMRQPGIVLTIDSILEKARAVSPEASEGSMRVFIKKLREKIDPEGAPSCIESRYGSGYVFQVPPNDS